MRQTVVLILFFVSGLAGLIHEVIWLRLFSLTFGNTTQAGAVVIGAFMGGMAAGAWFFGKRADRTRRPLFYYALLEFGVVLAAVFVLAGHQAVDSIYGWIFQWTGPESSLLVLIRIIFSVALMLPACAMMGGTLPVLARALIEHPSDSGKKTGILYAVNTVGAVCGVLFAGFYSIRIFGVYPTAAIAITANLLAGAAALLLSRSTAISKPRLEIPELVTGEQISQTEKFALALAASAGFFALALEVMYSRLILFAIAYTVYVWIIILAVFLAGIAAGSAAASRRSKTSTRAVPAAAVLLMWMSIGMWVSLIGIAKVDWVSGLAATFLQPGGWRYAVSFKFFLVGATLFFPAFFSGAAFPFLVRAYTQDKNTPGAKVGSLYAANTLGAIAGSILTGFVIVPLIGAQRGVFWGGVILFGLGGYTLKKFEPKRAVNMFPIMIGLAVAFLAVVIPGRPLFLDLMAKLRPAGYALSTDEDINATVVVYQSGDNREIAVNGVQVAGTDPAMRTTQILQGHVPMMMHTKPKKVLMVGFGSGETAHILSMYDVDRIDVVELCKAVYDAAPFFRKINGNIYDNPRFNGIVSDAKNYMHLTKEKYDVILNDSIHPSYLGNAALYTKDYFEDARDRLNEGGVMSCWIPLFDIPPKAFLMMVNTFASVFPNSAVLYAHTTFNRHALLVAKKDKSTPLLFAKRVASQLSRSDITKSLGAVGIDDPLDIINFVVLGKKELHEFLKDATLHTDNHPKLEFDAPRSAVGPDSWRRNLHGILAKRGNPLHYVTLQNLPDRENFLEEQKARYVAAGQVMNAIADSSLVPEELGRKLAAAKELSPGVAGVDSLMETIQGYAKGLAGITSADSGKRIGLALAQIKVGNLDQALKLLEDELIENPKSVDALGNIGNIYLIKGDTEKAVDFFNQVIKINPDDRIVYRRLGVAYYKDGEFGAAVKAFNIAVEKNDPNSELLVQLGMAQEKIGQLEQAEASFSKAISINPENPRAYVSHGSMLYRQKRFIEAQNYLEKAIDLDPLAPTPYGNLGLVYMEQKKFGLARSMFERLLQIDPDNPTAKELLIKIDSQSK